MTLLKKCGCFILTVGLVCSFVRAQDIHFSQFYQAPLNLNPAMTGSFKGNIRATANFKNQWSSIPNHYQTINASYEMKFLKNKWENGYIAGGLNLFSDKAGGAKEETPEHEKDGQSRPFHPPPPTHAHTPQMARA
jgi:hypothetical protein